MSARNSRFNKKTVLVAGLDTVLLAGGSAAFAYWSTGGVGLGDITAGTGTAGIVPVQDPTIATNLTSLVINGTVAGTAVPLYGTFQNTSTSPLTVTNLVVAVASGTQSATYSGLSGCTSADFFLVQPTKIGASSAVTATTLPLTTAFTVTASQASYGYWGGASIVFVNSTSSQDGCKGATVALKYTVTN